MNFPTAAVLVAVLLCATTLALLETGRHFGRRQLERGEPLPAGLGTLEGAVFGLMGLLIAFSFNGAAQRLDARRQLIVQESNAIGTAWLRLDLLPATAQPALRDDFRRYLDQRLAAYHVIPDLAARRAHLDSAAALQSDIWRRVTAALPEAPPPATIVVVPAMNEMFDIAATRDFGAAIHPPLVIWILLGILTLACALLAGYDMAANPSRSWIHVVAFTALLVGALLVVVDLEFPRVGLIRLSDFDQALTALRAAMR